MMSDHRFPFARVVLVGAAVLPGMAFAQAPQQTLDAMDNARAMELFSAGKYQEAIPIWEGIPQKYPTSAFIPEAAFRAGYAYYMIGDYDKALANLQKVPTLRGASPEVLELATSMIPQISVAKASKLAPDDPQRKRAFEEAVKGFDAFLQKFPNSPEVESANYGKAMALYQLGSYDQVAAPLRANLQRFPQSETIQDSQFLLALALGTLANETMRKATDAASAAPAKGNYDEAEKLLGDLINKQRTEPTRADVALANDARFQIAELNFARASFMKGDDKAGEEERRATLTKALESYRLVQPKEIVLQAQRNRINYFKNLALETKRKADIAGGKRIDRVVDKEQEKLAGFESRGDQTLAAKVKMGQIFFQLDKYDEARVVLNFAKPFVEDPDQKKTVAYNLALSYGVQKVNNETAEQALSAKAVESYEAFKAAYPKDPVGDNLALIVGARFVESEPEKAIKYFQESLADYPKGRFTIQALVQQAAALSKLKRYDEAIAIFKKTLDAKPDKEVAAAAEFGIATIQRETGKIDDAIASFKRVRDNYAGTQQAEQAAFFVGQMTLEKGDAKTAVAEFQTFLKNFPDSELRPEGTYYLATAQMQNNQKADALETYKQVAKQFPQSKVAPFSYFQRAQALMPDQKNEEMIAVMREYIAAYPDGEALFQAYDFIAQLQAGPMAQGMDAIATYEEYVKTKAETPAAPEALLKIAALWKGYAEGQPGRYGVLNDEQKKEWAKGVENSIAACERILSSYPESPAVALGLKVLLDCQRMRQQAKLIADTDVEKYFQDLAKKFQDKPSTRSKIIFTLANFTFKQDKAKAIQQMASEYDPGQKYAPNDLDLYGLALIEQGRKEPAKLDEAMRIYEKIAADFPVPKNTEPTKAPRDIQEAQAIALFGTGKVLQEQKKTKEASERFEQLKALYPWTDKMQEANYGSSLQLYAEKKYEEAAKLLIGVVREAKVAPEVRAPAMLLLAKINEDQGDYDSAINNYIKVDHMFTAVPEVAAEGLWRGAQLLERQARGEIPRAAKKDAAAPAAKAGAKAGEGAKKAK
jgi:TolA-binding protein